MLSFSSKMRLKSFLLTFITQIVLLQLCMELNFCYFCHKNTNLCGIVSITGLYCGRRNSNINTAELGK